jgi:hypothetical protein
VCVCARARGTGGWEAPRDKISRYISNKTLVDLLICGLYSHKGDSLSLYNKKKSYGSITSGKIMEQTWKIRESVERYKLALMQVMCQLKFYQH